jgi:hypothetical protein
MSFSTKTQFYLGGSDMIKRYALVAVILFSSLNAAIEIQDDSFSCIFSTGIEQEFHNSPDKGEVVDSTKISMEAIAQQDGTNWNDLIVNTIIELVNQIDKQEAANNYLILVKKSYDAIINTSNLEALSSYKDTEELGQNLSNFLQQTFNAMSSQESVLKQAIYFATFSDETVKKIAVTLSNCLQNYVSKINEILPNSDDSKTVETFKQVLLDLPQNVLGSLVTVFEEDGYEIDKQALGL